MGREALAVGRPDAVTGCDVADQARTRE